MTTVLIIISVVAVSISITISYLWTRRNADYKAGYNAARIEDVKQAEVDRAKFKKKSDEIDRLCTTHRQRLRDWWLRKTIGSNKKLRLPK